MKIGKTILTLILGAVALALPQVKDDTSLALSDKSSADLKIRQILSDPISTVCPRNAKAAYDYDDWSYAFDDLCNWLGNGQTIWTNGAYDAQDYYCSTYWDMNICLRMYIQYFCGENGLPVTDTNPAGAGSLDVLGCIGYFKYTINTDPPPCGGPPFPGAQITSGDHCWRFTTLAEPSPFVHGSAIVDIDGTHRPDASDCEPGAKLCKVPTTENGTIIGDAPAGFFFGPPGEEPVA